MFTTCPKTIVDGRRHRSPDRGLFGQTRDFCNVPAGGLPSPAADYRKGLTVRLVSRHRLLQPMQAKIIGPALELDYTHGSAQTLRQARQIPAKQLILQIAGGGGNHHPAPSQQRWNQIRQSLACAGARLYDQWIGTIESGQDGLGHGQLARSR